MCGVWLRYMVYGLVAGCVLCYTYMGSHVFALIPKASGDTVDTIQSLISGDANKPDQGFTEQYNNQAYTYSRNCVDVGAALSSGVMDWNTIYCYAVWIVTQLRNISWIVAAAMIIYSGYLYATAVYTGNENKGKSALTKSIIGVVVFSFALTLVTLAMRIGGFA